MSLRAKEKANDRGVRRARARRPRALYSMRHVRPRLFPRAASDRRTPLHCAAAARIPPLQFTRDAENKDEGGRMKNEEKAGAGC